MKDGWTLIGADTIFALVLAIGTMTTLAFLVELLPLTADTTMTGNVRFVGEDIWHRYDVTTVPDGRLKFYIDGSLK